MSSQFYNKYRHLFEEETYDQIKPGYDQLTSNYQQPNFKEQKLIIPTIPKQLQYKQSPIKDESSILSFQPQQQFKRSYSRQQDDIQQQQSRKTLNDERIRKQVMQDNIFKQPISEYQQIQYKPNTQLIQNQPQLQQQQNDLNERKFQQQTYNVFQDQDILDGIAPKKVKSNIQINNSDQSQNNAHQRYLQRLTDLDHIRKRYVDPKQLQREIDPYNQYKAALMKRVLVQFNGNSRKARLKDTLKI